MQPQALGAGASAESVSRTSPPEPLSPAPDHPCCLARSLGVGSQCERLSFLQQLSEGRPPAPAAAPAQSEDERGVRVAGQMGWGSSALLCCCSPAALTNAGLSAPGAGGAGVGRLSVSQAAQGQGAATGLRPGVWASTASLRSIPRSSWASGGAMLRGFLLCPASLSAMR